MPEEIEIRPERRMLTLTPLFHNYSYDFMMGDGTYVRNFDYLDYLGCCDLLYVFENVRPSVVPYR
jgi:hypothetical protein